MIIPISHDDMSGRRWPVITYGIVALNILIFLLTNGSIERQQELYVAKARQAFVYYNDHPWLKATSPLDTLTEQEKQSSRKSKLTMEAMQALSQDAVDSRGGVDDETKAAQQVELDNLVADMVSAKAASPLTRYAYTPGQNNIPGLITSQFLHSGWLHLIGNMLFLWLSGGTVEDRWGRILFPIFYLSAGVVAALVQKAVSPHSVVPLIGASGAIAGVMGAFVIKFAKTRIQFLCSSDCARALSQRRLT